MFFDDACNLDEGVACIRHGGSRADTEGDLDDGHGKAVARVCVVWDCKVHTCIDKAIVDKHGIHECAHLHEVVKHHNEHERGMHCMGCRQ